MRILIAAPAAFVALIALAACGQDAPPPTATATAPEQTEAQPAAAPAPVVTDFAAILAAQPQEVQARYQYRHPLETMEFFGIEPDMTVVEALPGGGWYTKLLLPHLGGEGQVVGANYAQDMWAKFGMSEEQVKQFETWVDDWTQGAQAWRSEGDADVSAFVFGSLPDSMKGSADAVLFIRALHNLARFEADGGFLSGAIQNAYDVLRPGGIVGVVQHKVREDMPDDWANGSAGYLKESYVIAKMEEAGFELMGTTDINANSKDQPTTSDFVWRLPPTLQTSRDNEALQAEMLAIGESNRMTLKFRKPA
jgi:predicted methyltransferase